MLNTISLQGRLVRDPELRKTQSDTSVASMTIAVERDFKTGDVTADFVDVVAWSKTAEFIKKYFHKGELLTLIGRLQSRKWSDKDGNNRTSWEVVADRVYFGGSRRDSEEPTEEDTKPAPQFEDVGDVDLPF